MTRAWVAEMPGGEGFSAFVDFGESQSFRRSRVLTESRSSRLWAGHGLRLIRPFAGTLSDDALPQEPDRDGPAELRDFLAEQLVMQCATIGPRGLPHMVPLWFLASDGELRGWTYSKSQKAKNLERDPRATLGIEDGVSYEELRGVTFECDVRMERDPRAIERFGLELFERYAPALTTEIREIVAKQARKRVALSFVPYREVTWDHRKLGGAY